MAAIERRSDPTVLSIRKIRDGKDRSQVFCEGFTIVEELFHSDWTPTGVCCTKDHLAEAKQIVSRSRYSAVPIRVLSQNVMDFCSDLSTAPGILATAKPTTASSTQKTKAGSALVLVIHGVQLPQNVGSLVRTAEGAGVSEIFVTSTTADPFGPKAIRGSAGSIFRMPVSKFDSLKAAVEILRKQNISSYAATANGALAYDEVNWKNDSALIMGSEGAGFAKQELDACDETIRIPMSGKVESLNVSNAAAVCLFEAARQRNHGS